MINKKYTMASFAQVVNNFTNFSLTENGAVVKATTTSPVLDFSHKTLRKTPFETIRESVHKIIDYAEKNNDVEALHDIIVLIFHKRNCRGGEGEKQVAYDTFLSVYDRYPKTMIEMVTLFGQFGYYKDLFQIWHTICDRMNTDLKTTDQATCYTQYYNKYNSLIQKLVSHSLETRRSDLTKILNDEAKHISLIGKWMPREGSHFDQKVYWIVSLGNNNYHKLSMVNMFTYYLHFQNSGKYLNLAKPFPSAIKKEYRQGNTLLTAKLNVPEIYMCAKKYALITHEKVASKAMAKYRKAFLNEKLKEPSTAMESETGNRFPNDPDRVQCRKNLINVLTSDKVTKLKSSVTEPHEIVESLMKGNMSSAEQQLLFALWDNKKTDVMKHINEVIQEKTANGATNLNIGNLLPMIDVSGSMSGEPMNVAIALGIMCSELHPKESPLHNVVMSFTDLPALYKFTDTDNLSDKIKTVQQHVGYSTDFQLAMKTLLDMCVSSKVLEKDLPDLIVFTDCQFNAWGGTKNWATDYQNNIVKMWANSGYTRVPRMIFWNLRSGTPGFIASKNTPGVQMLQGYSPNLMKFVFFSDDNDLTTIEVTNDDGTITTMKTSNVSPWETFRTIMSQSKYDIVRTIMFMSEEGLLAQFKPTDVPNTDSEFVEIAPLASV